MKSHRGCGKRYEFEKVQNPNLIKQKNIYQDILFLKSKYPCKILYIEALHQRGSLEKGILIQKKEKRTGIMKICNSDLHPYMMAMHMRIQENTDFQYI